MPKEEEIWLRLRIEQGLDTAKLLVAVQNLENKAITCPFCPNSNGVEPCRGCKIEQSPFKTR